MSPAWEIIISGAFGVAAGVVSGFLGIGGGAILAPLLAVGLGIEQHRAQGISLAALLPPVGLPAVLAYRKSGVRVDVTLVLLLIVGFIVGALAGAWSAHRLPSRELRWCFAAFLAMSALYVGFFRKGTTEGETDSTRRVPVWMAVSIGMVAGSMSGLLGVGGAIVALPLLKRYGGLSRLQAQATTLAMMLPPIGLPAVYVYANEQGGLPWPLLGAVAAGFALGAWPGAQLAARVSARRATLVYAGFLSVMAVVLIARG